MVESLYYEYHVNMVSCTWALEKYAELFRPQATSWLCNSLVCSTVFISTTIPSNHSQLTTSVQCRGFNTSG